MINSQKKYKPALQIVPEDKEIPSKWLVEMYPYRDLFLSSIDDTFHPLHMNTHVDENGVFRACRSNFATRDDTLLRYTIIGDYYIALARDFYFNFDFTVKNVKWSLNIKIGQSDYYKSEITVNLTEDICKSTGNEPGAPGHYRGFLDLNEVIKNKKILRSDGSSFEDTVIRFAELYIFFSSPDADDVIEVRHLSLGNRAKDHSDSAIPKGIVRPRSNYIASEILLEDLKCDKDKTIPLAVNMTVENEASLECPSETVRINDAYLYYDFRMESKWDISLYFVDGKGIHLQEIIKHINADGILNGMSIKNDVEPGLPGKYKGAIHLEKLLYYCQSVDKDTYVHDYGRYAKLYDVKISCFGSGTNIINKLSIESPEKVYNKNEFENPEYESTTVNKLAAVRYEKPTVESGIPKEENADEVVHYYGGKISEKTEVYKSTDVKRIYKLGDIQRIYNYPDGYRVDLPVEMNPDFSMAKYICKYIGDDIAVVASKERKLSMDMDENYDKTLTRFIGNPDIQKLHGIEFFEVIRNQKLDNGLTLDVFRGSISDMPQDMKSRYSYIFLHDIDSNIIYRFLLKYKQSYDPSSIEKMIYSSFALIPAYGTADCEELYKYPVIPSYWNDETKAFYKNLCGSDIIKWGIFHTANEAIGLEWNEHYEGHADAHMELVLHYIPADRLFLNIPFTKKVYEQDRVLVLTVRWERLSGVQPIFDLIRGKFDEDMHQLARQIKSIRHPVIVRMENEYNSDWTQACGMLTMCDPEIYRDAWIRFYNIILDEKVDNAIFMSNPQSDDDYPQQRWNYFVNYLPPKEYIQIAGLTIYNMGTTVPFSKFSFEYLYSIVQRKTEEFFSNWPWVIGEFGCAGPFEEVDKPQWIKEMFETCHKFPNIKGALWFDLYDGDDSNKVRDFRLLSPPASARQFVSDIEKQQKISKTERWKTWTGVNP